MSGKVEITLLPKDARTLVNWLEYSLDNHHEEMVHTEKRVSHDVMEQIEELLCEGFLVDRCKDCGSPTCPLK